MWADPTLREALAGADLIVLGESVEDGREGEEQVRFRALRTLKGEAPSDPFPVAGLIDPTRVKGPTFIRRGQRALLLLKRRRAAAGYAIPTPTFGRFRVAAGEVVKHAALRDTWLRLDLPLADYERFLRLRLGQPAEGAWVRALQASLLGLEPKAEPAELARAYLALEVLVQAGRARDQQQIAPFLHAKWPLQLRVSACRALGAVAGRAAAGRLLRVAREDESKAVRTAAIRCLAALDPPPQGLVERLAGLLPKATSEPFYLNHGPNDPRTNQWPAPRVALLEAIARHGAGPVRAQLLALLEEEQVALTVFSAALAALLELDGEQLVDELVARFRPGAQVGAKLYNRELCIALTKRTRQRFGEDTAAWRRWAKERSR